MILFLYLASMVYDITCIFIGSYYYSICNQGGITQSQWLISSSVINLSLMLLMMKWPNLKYITFMFNIVWSVVGFRLFFYLDTSCNLQFSILMFVKFAAMIGILAGTAIFSMMQNRPLDVIQIV